MMSINDMRVAMFSTDVSKIRGLHPKHGKDVNESLLQQGHFYPLYPTETAVPYSLKWENMVWNENPHLMFLISDFPEIVYEFGGTTIINLGSMTKRNKLGYISKVTIVDNDAPFKERVRVDLV